MGLFDGLVGSLGSLLGQQGDSDHSVNVVGALLGGGESGGGSGGIANVLETMAANGLSEHIASWTGNGANLPISPEQITAALGSEQVQQLAQASGLPIGDFLQHLSDHLPAAAAATAAPTDSDSDS
jgi:uncharacterized protein YidB (DUF937 family)